MRTTILIAAAAAALAACATASTYGPAAREGAAGFTQTRIENDRWRVVYTGGAADERATVENFALRRAAEIAVQNSAEWFQVVRRATDAEAASGGVGSSVGIGVGGGSYGRSSVGGGVGLNFGGRPRREYVTTLEIILGSGPKPHAGPDIYDARDVLQTIAPAQ